VVNEDEVSVTRTMATKQLHYMRITAKVKRLFLFKEIVKQMRWHKEGKHYSKDSNIMLHLVDGEAWQTLDCFDLEFARNPKCVHLHLSTDGFHPHSTDSSPYSCWPVFIMPYNLPPDKYLKQGFIFLLIVIPGPKEPKKQMNIFLRPLMEELKEL
jgi:hypothetical protein